MLVKVVDGAERFWCQVVKITFDGLVYAIVQNRLIDDHDFDYGDVIVFPIEAIIERWID